MSCRSQTGLLPSDYPQRSVVPVTKAPVGFEDLCDVSRAPIAVKPYAALYNPYASSCSILCNHPAEGEAKKVVRKVKEAWIHNPGKLQTLSKDLAAMQEHGSAGDRGKVAHDIVTEEMFRRTHDNTKNIKPIPKKRPPKKNRHISSSRSSSLELTASEYNLEENILTDRVKKPFKRVVQKKLRTESSKVKEQSTEQTKTTSANLPPKIFKRPSALKASKAVDRRNPVKKRNTGKVTSATKIRVKRNKSESTVHSRKQKHKKSRSAGYIYKEKTNEKESKSIQLLQVMVNVMKEGYEGKHFINEAAVRLDEASKKIDEEEEAAKMKARKRRKIRKISNSEIFSKKSSSTIVLKKKSSIKNKNAMLKSASISGLTMKRVHFKYTETDSRPLTPAPTLASGKSRGSRRCLTPDEALQRTRIVLDLRRSHSQETLYFHGHSNAESTAAPVGSEPSTLPSLNLAESSQLRGKREQLPPLASPLVLARRYLPPKKDDKSQRKSQLKALNIKTPKKPKGQETPKTERSKPEDESSIRIDGGEEHADSGETRRRGKRRKKAGGRLTSAGFAQTQQDPETQIAGIGTDSNVGSSRASISQSKDDDSIVLMPPPAIAPTGSRRTDSFLDDDILKYLHREVDLEAIETEFDTKRRYVLQEAMRTKPERPYGTEMQTLLKEIKIPNVSLANWLHTPRVFSRQSAQFSLPIDCYTLQELTPMTYAAQYVTIKKSKQLLYLTVLQKLRPGAYRMPISCIEEGLMQMMGSILTKEQCDYLSNVMRWHQYDEPESFPDDIKLLSLSFDKFRHPNEAGDGNKEKTIKFRTWCAICAICERMFGKLPPRDKDPPDGIEINDFSLIETKLSVLSIDQGLVEILNTIRLR